MNVHSITTAGNPIFGPNAFSYCAPTSPGGGWGSNNDVCNTSWNMPITGTGEDEEGWTSSSDNAGWSMQQQYNNNNNNSSRKIFVGGISWSSNEGSLQSYFEQFGPVESVEIMRDRVTGNPRGFAFVVFAFETTVDLIFAHVDTINANKHVIDSKLVDVKRAHARLSLAPINNHHIINNTNNQIDIHHLQQQQQQQQQHDPPSTHHLEYYYNGSNGTIMEDTIEAVSTSIELQQQQQQQQLNKIFVGGLHPAVDRDELKAHFSIYGYIKDACVMFDPITKRSRGFGFITYEDGNPNAAHRAMAPDQMHSFRDKVVELKYAQPKCCVSTATTTTTPVAPLSSTTTLAVILPHLSTSPTNTNISHDCNVDATKSLDDDVSLLQQQLHQLQITINDTRQSERALISMLLVLCEKRQGFNVYDIHENENEYAQILLNSQILDTSTTPTNNSDNDITQILETVVNAFRNRLLLHHENVDTTTNMNSSLLQHQSKEDQFSLVNIIVQLDHRLASIEKKNKNYK